MTYAFGMLPRSRYEPGVHLSGTDGIGIKILSLTLVSLLLSLSLSLHLYLKVASLSFVIHHNHFFLDQDLCICIHIIVIYICVLFLPLAATVSISIGNSDMVRSLNSARSADTPGDGGGRASFRSHFDRISLAFRSNFRNSFLEKTVYLYVCNKQMIAFHVLHLFVAFSFVASFEVVR